MDEYAYAAARYDIENHVQEYVRKEVNCPWIRLTVNPITDSLEIWFDQPGREPYLVGKKPFMGEMNLQEAIDYIKAADSSSESFTAKVARLEREREANEKARMDAYMDKVMPAAEKVYYEAYRDATGAKGFMY